MSPRIEIVQCIEDDVETLKPFDVELRVFDIGMISLKLDVRVELRGALFGNLENS